MAHYIVDDRGFGGTFYTCSDCGAIFWDMFDDECFVNPDRCNICGAWIDWDENEYE